MAQSRRRRVRHPSWFSWGGKPKQSVTWSQDVVDWARNWGTDGPTNGWVIFSTQHISGSQKLQNLSQPLWTIILRIKHHVISRELPDTPIWSNSPKPVLVDLWLSRECIVGIVALFCGCFFAKRDDFFWSQTCQKAVAVGQTLVLCGFSPKWLWCLEVDSAFPLTHLTLLAHRLTTSGDQIFAECRILNSALFGCTAGCCDNFNIFQYTDCRISIVLP